MRGTDESRAPIERAFAERALLLNDVDPNEENLRAVVGSGVLVKVFNLDFENAPSIDPVPHWSPAWVDDIFVKWQHKPLLPGTLDRIDQFAHFLRKPAGERLIDHLNLTGDLEVALKERANWFLREKKFPACL